MWHSLTPPPLHTSPRSSPLSHCLVRPAWAQRKNFPPWSLFSETLLELIQIVLSTVGSCASLQCRVRRQNEKGELFISCLLRYSLNPSSPRTIPTTLPGVQCKILWDWYWHCHVCQFIDFWYMLYKTIDNTQITLGTLLCEPFHPSKNHSNIHLVDSPTQLKCFWISKAKVDVRL